MSNIMQQDHDVGAMGPGGEVSAKAATKTKKILELRCKPRLFPQTLGAAPCRPHRGQLAHTSHHRHYCSFHGEEKLLGSPTNGRADAMVDEDSDDNGNEDEGADDGDDM